MPRRPFFGGVVPGGAVGSAFAWWYLSKKQKQVLEEERKMGRFGGETAKGVGRAPYYWPQEHGEPRAGIKAQHVVQAAVLSWQGRVSSIVREFMRGT